MIVVAPKLFSFESKLYGFGMRSRFGLTATVSKSDQAQF